MKTKPATEKRKRFSKKSFEELKIEEQKYTDEGINPEDDPERNNIIYYDEEGLTSTDLKPENDHLLNEK